MQIPFLNFIPGMQQYNASVDIQRWATLSKYFTQKASSTRFIFVKGQSP